MKLRITIDGKTYEAEVEILEAEESAPEYPEYPATLPVFVPAAIPRSATSALESAGKDSECRSPVTGMVIKIHAEPGQAVQAEEVVAVLESMKMEMPITVPRAGVVKNVLVAPGSPVKINQLLVELE